MSESIEATAYPMHRDLSQRDPSLSAGDPFKTEHRGEDIGSLARSDSQRCFADNYAWNAIVVGAIAMVATYPGRTHGLGMVAEPLLSDLGLSDDAGRIQFAWLGFWATIAGATFCIPMGKIIEKFGERLVLASNLILLGLSVIVLSSANNLTQLFIGLLLTRGFGQASLSVVSITIVSNSHAKRNLGLAMAFYAILSLPFHLVLINSVGYGLNSLEWNWRWVTTLIGATVILLSFSALFIPKFGRFSRRHPAEVSISKGDLEGIGIWDALATPAFWLFGLTISIWGMIYSGVALFNQDIFHERGFEKELYFRILSFTSIVGLFSKFVFGWAMRYLSVSQLLGISMLFTSLSLVGLPLASETWHAYLYGLMGGISSGGIALLFFSCWGTLYGHRDLGKIQGVAQSLTILASAIGPVLFSTVKASMNSYRPVFFATAGIACILAMLSFVVPTPTDSNQS